MNSNGLGPRQLAFCREYLIDLNATQAAIRAGYKPKTANKTGPRLLVRVGIQLEIQRLMNERAARLEIKADNVLREIATMAFGHLGLLFDFSGPEYKLLPANQVSPDAKKLLQSIKVKRRVEGKGQDAQEVEIVELKIHDRLAALEKLGRHLKLFTGDAAPAADIRVLLELKLQDLKNKTPNELYQLHRETLRIPP